MLKPYKCPYGKVVGVNGKKWIEKRDGNIEAEEHRVKCRKVAEGGGGKKVERGLQDKGCHERNIDIDGGSWRCCVESKRDMTRWLTTIETEGAIKRKAESKGNKWKTWPFFLNNTHVEDIKKTRRMHQQRLHVFLWFTILLFCLCPEMASSQVRK